MLQYNILSPEEKEKISFLYWRRIAIVWGGAFLLVGVFAGILFLPTYLTLTLEHREVLRNLEITETSPVQMRVKKIQQILGDLRKNNEVLKNKYEKAGEISSNVLTILGATPTGVFINSAEFNLISKRLNIQGNASTRAGLLRLQENLKKIPTIANVDIPLSDLVSESNIRFTIQVTLK